MSNSNFDYSTNLKIDFNECDISSFSVSYPLFKTKQEIVLFYWIKCELKNIQIAVKGHYIKIEDAIYAMNAMYINSEINNENLSLSISLGNSVDIVKLKRQDGDRNVINLPSQ